MADLKTTQLTEDTEPTYDDLIMTVNNPGGSPGNKKVQFANASKAMGWVDVRSYASINAAVTAIGATQTTLIIPNAQTLAANLTTPSTLSLVILNGGSIVKASTYTLTINGSFEAGLYQVFSGFSAGNVTFGVGSVKEAYPEWWQVNTTPGTTDMTTASQCAILSSSPKVVFTNGTYLVTAGQISATTAIEIVLLEGATIKRANSATDYDATIRLAANGCVLRGPGTVDENKAGQTGGYQRGVYVNASDCIVEELTITNPANIGIYVQGNRNKILKNKISGSNYYGIFIRASASAVGYSYNLIEGNYIDHDGAIESAIKIWGWDTAPYGAVSIGNIITNNTIILTDCSDDSNPTIGIETRLSPQTIIKGNLVKNGYMGISHTWDSNNSSITGNVCEGFWSVGVEALSSKGTSVNGNSLKGRATGRADITGILCSTTALASNFGWKNISGNSIEHVRYGIRTVVGESNLNIVGNSINDLTGVDDGTGILNLADYVSISNNIIDATGGQQSIRTNNASYVVIIGNQIKNGTYGIRLYRDAGTPDYINVIGNISYNLPYASFVMSSGYGINVMFKNNLPGGYPWEEASAATLGLPYSGDYFNITGTTNITSILASGVGRVVTLKFADVLTVTDGSNLKLALDFVTTPSDTITLVCDGTNWYELSRSVN